MLYLLSDFYLLGHRGGFNKKAHTESCWELPWAAPCCCCLSVCLGRSSLQVLELTPASPVSTCSRWPLPLDQKSCWTPGSTAQAPLQWYPLSTQESYSSLFEWTHPHSACGTHSTSLRIRSEPQVLEFSLPGSSLDLPQGPSRLALNSLEDLES